MAAIIGRFCVVRTYSAGVYCGVVIEQAGTACLLREARIIHRWGGAYTTIELANHGADMSYTRITEPCAHDMLLTEAISITPCTSEAEANLRQSRWGQ